MDKPISIKYIRPVPMFSALSDAELEQILRSDDCVVRQYRAKQKVIREGEIGDCMYVILRGSAEVLLQQSSAKRGGVVATLHDGDFFGESALFPWTDSRRNATVITTRPTSLLQIGKHHVLLGLERGIQKLCASRVFGTSALASLSDLNIGSVHEVQNRRIDEMLSGEQDQVHDALAACRLFRSLSPMELHKHAAWTSLKQFKDGDYVLREGDPGKYLYMVQSGEVEAITVDDNGKLAVLGVLGPGKYFGEQSLSPHGSGLCNAYVRARGEVVLIRVSGPQFKRILQRDRALDQAIKQLIDSQSIIIRKKKKGRPVRQG